MNLPLPDADFYLWTETSLANTDLVHRLFDNQNATVLTGRFLAQDNNNKNLDSHRVGMA